ncbi:MAG: hypothetical protein ABR887_07420 [Methanoregulaceae archaeon]|jgi:hypothetical protein
MAIDLLHFILLDFIDILMFGFVLILYVGLLILTIDVGMTKLATYHTPKTQYNINGEPFGVKFWRVLIVYAFLSLIIFIAIIITLRFSGITNVAASLLVAQMGTVVLLILMRLLLNPTWDHSLIKLKPEEKPEVTIKLFKERIFSLFFSYVCITWIVFMLYLLVSIGGNVQLSEAINYFIPPDLDLNAIIMLTVSYAASLFVLALVTELFLLRSLPIVQTPWGK